jgi:MFS family permease
VTPVTDQTPAVARLQRRRAAHEAAAARVPLRPVRDARGGLLSVGDALARLARLRARIEADEREGSHVHERISRGQRWQLRVLPLLDGLILFWFLAGVLNADLRTVDVTVVVAASLALLCTVAVAAWTAVVGEHLQRWKDRDRNLVWCAVDGVGWGMLALTAVMAALLAAMMYIRVSDEVFQATGVPGVGATVIGLTLSAAVVLVNAYILHLTFSDGSSVTRELDRLGRTLAPHLRRRHRNLARAERVRGRIRLRLAAEERLRGPFAGGRRLELPAAGEIRKTAG